MVCHPIYDVPNYDIILFSSDEFSVATPDETAGKESEFSLVGRLENK